MATARNRSGWLLVSLSLLTAVGTWLLWPGTAAAPPASALPPGDDVAAPAPPARGTVDDVRVLDRAEEPPPATAAAEVDLEHPFAYRLEVRLVDAFGLPVPDALVFVAPPLAGLALLPETTDARGFATLDWRARTARMDVSVAVLAWGLRQPMRRLPLEADRPHTATIAIRGAAPSTEHLERQRERTREDLEDDARRVRIGRMRRRDDLDVLCGRTQFLFAEFLCTNCHDPSHVAAYSTLARCGEFGPGLHPAAKFSDLGALQVVDAELQQRARLAVRAETQRPGAASEARTATVTGTVLDGRGEPAVDVPVVWLDRSGALRRRTTTNTQGRYRLDGLAEGPLELRAGGGGHGEAVTTVVTFAKHAIEWSPTLAAIGVVAGVAEDENGGRLARWLVEFETIDRGWAGLATTSDDGRFTIAGAPGVGDCLLWPAGSTPPLPVLHGRTSLPDNAEVHLALQAAAPTRARLRLRPVLPPGCEWAQVDTRITQLDTGRVAAMRPIGRDNSFELEDLCAGPYRVEVGAPVLGWVDGGIVTVDGRGLWDLGAVALPAPGRLRLRVPDGTKSPLELEHAFCRRLPELDVHEHPRRETNGDLLLPAGQHLLLWRSTNGVAAVEFALQSGAVTTVAIAPHPTRK